MRNKVANYSFDGPFSVYCTSYIDYKKSLGFKMEGSIFYLIRGMDNYFKKYGIMPDALILTQEMVDDYISYRSPETIKTQHMRMSLIRQFSLFMNRSFGMSFYVYPETAFVQVKNDFVPYILTHDEVERLIEVLDNIPEYRRYPNYHIIYPMLFRMLYGCGMRINEALGLKMVDIDFADGIIHLRDSKNGSERLLPMSESLRQYCLFFIERMHFSEQYDGYFYPSFYGGEYNSTPIYCQFRKFMKQAEIFRPDNTTPRVHDFRHTFAVHSLEKMVSGGMDIYCSLPVLSAYMGHRGIESTEKYLRLTETAYNSILDSMHDIYDGLFPEVSYE